MMLAALTMPILLGFASLAIDTSLWYATKRSAQSAADSASIAGALELVRSNEAPVSTIATDAASAHGYSSANGDTITVNSPPASGPYAGAENAVEVIIRRPAPAFLVGMFMRSGFQIVARAVALGAQGSDGDGCVYALNESASGAIRAHGNAEVVLDCAFYANSDAPDAITQVGSSCLTGTGMYAVGGASGSCLNPDPTTGVPQASDPFAELPAPPYGGCDVGGRTNVAPNSVVTLSPGTYCGDLTVRGTVHFEPGLYYIHNAKVHFNSGADVTGDQVMFFLDSAGNNQFHVNGQASVNLSADTDLNNPYAGILIYQDRDLTAGINRLTLNGGSSSQLNGVIYAPTAELQLNGNSQMEFLNTLIVFDTIDFGGATRVDAYEAVVFDLSDASGGGSGAMLVE